MLTRTKGRFTLVEMLVVVAVISILAALLMPALGKARGMAKRIACANQMKQCSTAHLLYSDDYNGYVFGWKQDYSLDTISWQRLFIPLNYLPHHGIMVCPETRHLFAAQGKNPDSPSYLGYGFFNPLLNPDYMTSARQSLWGDFYSKSCATAPYTIIFDTKTMRAPSSTFLLMDAVGYGVGNNLPNWCFGPKSSTYMASFWHHGNTVAAYMDGHVEAENLGALRELGFTKLYQNGVAMDIQ